MRRIGGELVARACLVPRPYAPELGCWALQPQPRLPCADPTPARTWRSPGQGEGARTGSLPEANQARGGDGGGGVGIGERPGPSSSPGALHPGEGAAPKPAPLGPRVPARLPPACPGLGDAQEPAAAGNLHPGRFCSLRANSRGLKVFHLERQSAFFLPISGQTPTVPGTSSLPNAGAAVFLGAACYPLSPTVLE